MKILRNSLFIVCCLTAIALTSCKKDNAEATAAADDSAENTEVQAADNTTSAADADGNYMVTKGMINWLGDKKVGTSHNGTIRVKTGELVMADGNISNGTFVIDMASIENSDLKEAPDKQAKLVGHLKSADFFDIESHATAAFQVTEVMAATDRNDATHIIKGNLNMRGISKPISFPAKVSIADGKLMATTPEFTIDRTNWGVNFNSSILKTAQDALINDDVKLTLSIEAMKQ